MSRTTIATVLVLLGCLLAGPAVMAYAVDREIADQDRYLAAVTPLADDPVVRGAIADRIADAISERLTPGDRELPAGLREAVDTGVRRMVDGDRFRSAWIAINREAHPRVIAALRGEGASVRIEDDTVLLDVGLVVEEAKQRLAADGVPLVDRLPRIDASVPMFSRPAVRQAIPAFGTLERLGVVLPIAVIALLLTGIAISARRGATLLVAGIGLVAAMLLVLLYQRIGRGQLTSRSQSPELSGAFYDALTDFLTSLRWIVLAAGVAAALAGVVLVSVGARRLGSP